MRIWAQLLLIGVAAAAAVGGYRAYTTLLPEGESVSSVNRGGRGAIPVMVAPVTSERLANRIEAVGTTRASRSVDIVSTASGRVVSILFESGQRVTAGDVLLTLDDDIERANLAESQANLSETLAALERGRSLRRNNTVSQAQVDQLAAKYTVAQADFARAERRLADRTVRAPFAGVTGLRRVDIGARIDDDTVVTTLDDLSEIRLEFQLPEILYGQVQPGVEITAQSAAFPGRVFRATIASIDSRIDETARAFRVQAVIANPDFSIPAGMFMTVSVALDTRDALMVPEAAVIFDGAETHVFVAADGKAQRRAVRLGKRSRGYAEVNEGLSAGEMVVQRGTQNLRDGAAVEILQDGSGSESRADKPAGQSGGKS